MKKNYYIYLITIFLTSLTGIVDILTTYQFRLSAIYIISIFVAAYFLNKYYSIFLCLLSISFSLYTIILYHESFEIFILWNAIMTISIYFIVVYLSTILKKKIHTEKVNYSLNKQNQLLKNNISKDSTLIHELHHRVKNNFASIESLINLTLNANSPDPLKSIKNRLITYRLLYDKLCYSPETNSIILLNEYLNELIKLIFENYQETNPSIKYKIYGGDFEIKSKTANTIGLIINELTTNSIKYAFTDISEGSINISLIKKENIITMIYFDNGRGFDPNQIESNKKHLGLLLIENLTQQLNGNIKYTYNNGSQYTFDFHIN